MDQNQLIEHQILRIKQNGLIYSIQKEEKTANIIECKSTAKHIRIPFSINYKSNEYIVKSITNEAFQRTLIKSIQFPPNSKVQTIEKDAFYYSSIESIEIPSSLVHLKEGWCNEASNLTKINLSPDNPIYKVYENKFIIGKSSPEQENYDVLVFCIRNIKEAFIPSFIKIIDSYAFNRMSIKHIQIPDNSKLKIIKNNAFSYSLIENIIIPPSLVELKEEWCFRTSKLTNIFVSPNNPYYLNLNDEFIISKSNENSQNFDLLVFARRDIRFATIPGFIKIIGPFAFFECRNLQKVKFSNNSNLQVIEKKAFSESLLEKITIPSSVTQICEGAFAYCTKLKQFEIPSNSELKIIEKEAFSFTFIESIMIPSSLVELKEEWCLGIRNLINITVSPNNPRYTMYENELLIGKSSVNQANYDILVFAVRNIKQTTIPKFIKTIESQAFFECNNVHHIEIPIDSELQIIKKEAFYGSSIESIYLPSHLTKICEGSFTFCRKLKNVEIPNNSNLQIIEKNSFSFSTIESFYAPSNVTFIGEEAFYECINLQKMEIPINSKLRTIEKKAFENAKFSSIFIPSNLIDLKKDWFYGASELNEVTVSQNNPIYSTYENKLLIKKTSIEQENYNVLVFCFKNVKTLKIPNFIEVIGKYAFNLCKKIQRVVISADSQIKKIQKFAFLGSQIKYISISPGLEKICQNAFQHCQVQQVDLPINSKLQIIDNYAFLYSQINRFSVPFHLKRIGEGAFSACYNLKRFEIPVNSELQIIEKEVFSYSSLESISIPSQVKQIGSDAFYPCDKLKIIEFNENSDMLWFDQNTLVFSQNVIIMIPINLSQLFQQKMKYDY